MKTAISTRRVGPQHDGQRMSLERFARARTEPGHLYELERGVVVVTDIPGVPHELVKAFIRDALAVYKVQHPETVFLVSDGSGSVVRMPELESERHPDVTVYCTPPPSDDEQAWDDWTPEVVIEVVSRSSRKRDYETKRDDYLAAGVREYWVIDPLTRSATLFTRRGDTWRRTRLTARGVIRTSQLPGFELRLGEVFAARR